MVDITRQHMTRIVGGEVTTAPSLSCIASSSSHLPSIDHSCCFRLPQWRWPLIGPYNGFSGGARIRGWQLNRFYRQNGWLHYDGVCSVTGAVGHVGLHNEDYSRPWTACPVSKRAHTLIHTRARYSNAWANFLANEALPDTWAKTLSSDGGFSIADRDCGVVHLLEHAPHPQWIVVPENEFDHR
jgi:hypothetical protein